jgi:plasmid stabilization system protein ParE
VKPYVVAPEAESDLQQIWRYLFGEAGLAVADRIQGELVDAFERLAELPGKGHKRPDLTRQGSPILQRVSVHDCVPSSRDVEFVAVLHGKRDIKRLLKTRTSR